MRLPFSLLGMHKNVFFGKYCFQVDYDGAHDCLRLCFQIECLFYDRQFRYHLEVIFKCNMIRILRFLYLQSVIIMKSKHLGFRQFTYLLLSNGLGWVTFSYTFPSLSIHDFIFDFWHSLKHSCFNALWSKPYKGWLASSEAWPSMVNTKTFSNNLYIMWGTLTWIFLLLPLDGGPVR